MTTPSSKKPFPWLYAGLVVIALAAVALFFARDAASPPRTQRAQATPIAPDSVPEGPARKLAELLARDVPKLSPVPEGPVYVALRSGGKLLEERWQSGEAWNRSAIDVVLAILKERPMLASQVDAIELCLSYDYAPAKKTGTLYIQNVHRGVRGLLLKSGDKELRTCPTAIVARNKTSENLEQDFRERFGEDARDAQVFEAHQLLALLSGERPRVATMLRGNEVVPLGAVNMKSVRSMAEGMASYLKNQVQPDGRMIYMYYPSRGDESRDNNMIRQFMASVCLVRWGVHENDPETLALAEKNIRYNLEHFYREEDGLGLITYENKTKLGAVALAALAIVEAPFRDKFAAYEPKLEALVTHMQQPSGEFRTFYKSDQNDNQNFYPGEALLLWATLYAQKEDGALLERIMRSFRYYRTWHRENLNPAFTPWHTQAYFRVWQKTGDQELADFIFEMNDWLLSMQQWDDVQYPDIPGRFHDPKRPEFGPPHASSTGVYLEGLIDAYRLAVAKHDETRRARYRTAILRGLRSMMQQQFVDDVDMFYVSKRKFVEGGIRTNLYDNAIRVDNVQHPLMGMLRIMDTFDAEGTW